MKSPLNFSTKALVLFIAISACASCAKKTSLRVNVKYQPSGQAEQIGAGDVVIARNVADSTDFVGGDANSAGTIFFDDIKPATYKVSSQQWVGTGALQDEKIVTVAKGHSEEVNLLLQ
jgi:hypothetical protein